ncbi:hypothetical protein LIER_09673 [Lithospermum erythrorhizon]|uniref:Uncharacterized protein n=1 Tax=Lithospermum erythrorhizon TaxID=34254 RepID=A0AAV3PGP5_LITER
MGRGGDSSQRRHQTLKESLLVPQLGERSVAEDVKRVARKTSVHRKQGKLEYPWEGPYLVRRIVGPAAHELETLEGCRVLRSWKACHLRKYHV